MNSTWPQNKGIEMAPSYNADNVEMSNIFIPNTKKKKCNPSI